eukprot:UN15927
MVSLHCNEQPSLYKQHSPTVLMVSSYSTEYHPQITILNTCNILIVSTTT